MARLLKFFSIVFPLLAAPCWADIRLPRVIGSNMVLQRNAVVNLWGWADPGETLHIACDWNDGVVSVTADADGQWQAQLHTTEAGGPHTLTLTGKNRITLDGILFGEVWLASGQSNMEMPLAKVSRAYTGVKDFEREISQANYPEVRLFQVGNFSSKRPLEDVQPGLSMYGVPPAPCRWQLCSPKTVATFSSTAYFFARHLHRQLKVPVGIIDASWGGTSAECWTPLAGLKKLGYSADVERAVQLPQQANQKIPSRLYNGMIHPLRRFRIRGVIWYQGESNVGRADKYHELFSTMISEWRAAFGYDFPFYFVQIAPYNYRNVNAAYLREAQLKTLTVPKTGMVVTMDIGNCSDIHPKNKQEVGRRLALWALAKDYGRSVVYSGPIFRRCLFADRKARIQFDHVGSGLTTRDGNPPNEFQIAGSDQVFYPAKATIDGDEVVVWSDQVSQPAAVRFAFSNCPKPNLMNRDGLPASPFRTDKW